MTLLPAVLDTPWMMMDFKAWFTTTGTVGWQEGEYFPIHHICKWEILIPVLKSSRRKQICNAVSANTMRKRQPFLLLALLGIQHFIFLDCLGMKCIVSEQREACGWDSVQKEDIQIKAGICQEFKLLSQSMQSLLFGDQSISPQSTRSGWDSVSNTGCL